MFPFDLPGATALYLTLLIVTMVPHILFVGYLLLASCWALLGDKDGLATKLTPTLPVALSGVITAAIAPLLFLQILYREEHYTANLLLSHRWMVMLPVLIIGFYALYAVRLTWIQSRPNAGRLLLILALASFIWTGYSWSENHLLAIGGQAEHVAFYESGKLLYPSTSLLFRISTFAFGAIPIGAMGILMMAHRSASPSELRRLAVVAIIGLLASLGFAAAYRSVSVNVATTISLPAAQPWLGILALGAIGILGCWTMVARRAAPSNAVRYLGTTFTVLAVLGGTVIREMIRVTSLGESRMNELGELHSHSAASPGLGAFVVCTVVLAGSLVLVARTIRTS